MPKVFLKVCSDNHFVQLLAMGLIRKVFLKKKDAIKALHKKSIGLMKKRYLIEDLDVEMEGQDAIPLALQPLLNPILEQVHQARQQVEAEVLSIKGGLHQLTDDELSYLKKELSKKQYAEDQIMTLMNVMLKDINKLDTFVLHIKKTKQEVISGFVQSFAEQYNIETNAEMKYDLKSIRDDITELQTYRRGIRQQVRSSESNANTDESSGCFLMWFFEWGGAYFRAILVHISAPFWCIFPRHCGAYFCTVWLHFHQCNYEWFVCPYRDVDMDIFSNIVELLQCSRFISDWFWKLITFIRRVMHDKDQNCDWPKERLKGTAQPFSKRQEASCWIFVLMLLIFPSQG